MDKVTTERLAAWRREWEAATDLRAADLDELAEHLLDAAEHCMSEGASAEDAIAQAIQSLGPPEKVAAEYARVRSVPRRWDVFLSFLVDLRFAARQVRARPYFVSVAVGSVAIAIAANALVFSVVNGLLLKDPGYGESERLVEVYTGNIDDPRRQSVASWPISDDLGEYTDLFEGVVGYEPLFGRLAIDGSHLPIVGEIVDGDFFEVLQVPLAIGRSFSSDDERAGAQVAIVAYGTWQERFGGRPDVLGTTIEINDEPLTVIGVAPEGFSGAMPGFAASVWMPRWVLPLGRLLTDGEVRPEANRERWLAQLKARLAPGVSAVDAEGALGRRLEDLTRAYPVSYAGVEFRVMPTDDVSLSPAVDGVAFSLAGGVMAVVAMVLLIASMNLAGFLLARGADRWDELQLRYALGATRARVVGQLFAESLIVAGLGGALGLALCQGALGLLRRVELPVPMPIAFDFSIDASVLLFTLGISVAAAVLFGLIPGLQATRSDRSLGAGGSAVRVAKSGGARRMLLAGQVAVSMVFLVLGGLFTRSLWAEAGEDPGFRTTRAGVLTLELGSADYGREELPTFLDRLRSEARRTPALSGLAFTTRVPMGSVTSMEEVAFPAAGPEGAEVRSVEAFSVGPDYLDAMEVGVLTGRGVMDGDRLDTPPVVLVSRSFMDQYGTLGAALGSTIELETGPVEIVGVVEDIFVNRPREGSVPHLYLPLAQRGAFLLSVVGVATNSSGEALLALRGALEAVDPTVAVWGATTIEDHVAFKLMGPRVAAALLMAASSIALLLTVVGVIGSVTYSASRRRYEMAIRLSLGASAASVTRLVVASMLRAIVIGAVLGVALSLVGTGLLRGLLYGVGPFDPGSYLFAVAVLGVAAAAAAYLPARGVGREDLTTVLRDS